MPKNQRKYSKELKLAVLKEIDKGRDLWAIAKHFKIPYSMIYLWKNAVEEMKKQQSKKRLVTLENYKEYWSKLSPENQAEAKYLASQYGRRTAINYMNVVLSPAYSGSTRQIPKNGLKRRDSNLYN